MAQAGYTPIQLYFSTTAAAVPLAANLAQGELAINIVDGKLYYENNSGVVTLLASAAGSLGDVVGPASATDNALARFDLTTGKLIQNSVGILSDAGILTGLTGITSSGSITFSSLTSGRVTYAGTAGLLQDSANLTFNGTTLTANTIGAFTLGGTIAGGGNQINNVIIGTTTPLAGAFTTLTASSTLGVTGVSTLTAGAVVQGLTVGLGGGAIATNSAVGYQALNGTNTAGFNVALGYQALITNTSGASNTAVGYQSGFATTGSSNTFFGADAGTSVGSGSFNTAVGRQAGSANSGATASNNTAVGYRANYNNISGAQLVAIGFNAGLGNTSGSYNIAIGDYALEKTTTGSNNIGIGSGALDSNLTASNNTAVGYQSLYNNTASFNTAIGFTAGYRNSTGNKNTFVGMYSGYEVSTGVENTYVGYAAGPNGGGSTGGSYNTGLGSQTLYVNTTGSNNTAVGYQSLYSNTTASNNTAVGYQAGYYATGTRNAAFGTAALAGSSAGTNTGTDNTALGYLAMPNVTSGSYNTSVGGGDNSGGGNPSMYRLTTGNFNVAVGNGALGNATSGSQNTVVGYQAGVGIGTSVANTLIGYVAGASVTSNSNVFIGNSAGYTKTSGGNNTFVGTAAGALATTGTGNTFVGVNDTTNGCGYAMLDGSKNTIIGGFTGNQNSVDIRTASNFIVLSDGDGNPRLIGNNLGNWGIGVVPSQSFTSRNVFQFGPTMSIAGGTNYYPWAGYVGNNFYYDSTDTPKYLQSSGAAYVAINAHNPGNIEMYTADSGTAGNTVSFTRVFALYKDVTLALQGATVQTGTGITFPATQSASSNANTLDDYEEGTWTPTDASGAGLTFTVDYATYTKVGRAVSIQGAFAYPTTANTATALFQGFPFNAANAISMSLIYTDASVASFTYLSGNATAVYPLTPGVNVTNATLSGKSIFFAGTYFV